MPVDLTRSGSVLGTAVRRWHPGRLSSEQVCPVALLYPPVVSVVTPSPLDIQPASASARAQSQSPALASDSSRLAQPAARRNASLFVASLSALAY
jgi:hypothetical protein